MTDRPLCSGCDRPLFRSAAAGTRIPKGAPYKVCRNEMCETNRAPSFKSKNKNPKKGLLVPEPAPLVPKGFVTKQRQRVREFVASVSEGQEEMSIALLLALACEETGNVEAAAIISIKHRLDLLGYSLAT
jgi:hypothetical protein